MLPRVTDSQHEMQTVFTPVGHVMSTVGADKLPQHFPIWLWNEQSVRYVRYWDWWNGRPLDEVGGKLKDGTPIPRFPLRINPLRDLAEKHASYLLGAPADMPGPLIRSLVNARKRMGTDERDTNDEALARRCEDIIDLIWDQSSGSALQSDQAVTSQWAAGSVWQVVYDPYNTDLLCPVTFRAMPPDYFLPIWANGNYYDLLECWVVYNISAAVASEQYGIASDKPFVLYLEHWTKKTYSIWVDGVPIKNQLGKTLLNAPNPFKFVPYEYIPHLRAGGFFGLSHVDDIEGLIKEINARVSDEGLAIKLNINPKRFAANIQGGTPQEIELAPGVRAIDLGTSNASTNYKVPEVKREDPPTIPEGMADFPERLFGWYQRLGKLTNVAYGEDEGSQRSGETYVQRMMPSIQHAMLERQYWTVGLTNLAYKALGILAVHGKGDFAIPADYRKRVLISQDWPPFIPRERSTLTQELVQRTGGKPITSQETAIQMLGDIRDVKGELERIQQEAEAELERSAKYAVQETVESAEGTEKAKATYNPKPAPKAPATSTR